MAREFAQRMRNRFAASAARRRFSQVVRPYRAWHGSRPPIRNAAGGACQGGCSVLQRSGGQDPGGDRVSAGGEVHGNSFAGHDIDCGVGPAGGRAAPELGGVPAPQLVRAPLAPVGPGRFGPGSGPRLAFEIEAVTGQNAVHLRRRHLNPVLIGPAVGELSARAVCVAPLVEQRQDLFLLPVQDPVDRAAPPGFCR